MHFVTPRSSARAIFSLYEDYRGCNGTRPPFDVSRWSSESVLLNAFHESVKPLGLNFVIVRADANYDNETMRVCRDTLLPEESLLRQIIDRGHARMASSEAYALAYPRATRTHRRRRYR